jgi:4-hydroxy-4-methyl-2-oxoglutarate aldolase
MSSARFDERSTITTHFERVARDLVMEAQSLSAATLHEAAGKIGALPSAIKPIATSFCVCGPALTVNSPGGDNLWLHRAIYTAQPGDVLVVHVSGRYEHGYWGEIMSTAAKARGLAGLVIDGCVRDGVLLESIGFPVFARGLCIRGTGKDFGSRGWINSPLSIGDVVVSAGDLVFGDGDGVVCIPRERAAAVLSAARERERHEAEACRRLEAGATTLDLYGWR